ncbi:MAG: CoA pyrophosphatase [Candidatus Lokiarchaeota archaeon]|nr:CoA pyrophosphatase [Candidatus Lokiarchaeota archaeon]
MSSLNLLFNEELIKEKIYTLSSPNRITLTDDHFTKSAVLFTIIPCEEKPYELVLIRRSEEGRRHRGEMAFPGGKFDPKFDNSLTDTVLRETCEEIGVPRKKVKLLGCLHDYPTMTNFIITPFVGVIDKDQQLTKQEREVQQIVKVPIEFFANKINFSERPMSFGNSYFPVYYFNFKTNKKNYMIWGATAFMIVSFIKIVYDYEISELGSQEFRVKELKNFKNFILSEDYANYLRQFKDFSHKF